MTEPNPAAVAAMLKERLPEGIYKRATDDSTRLFTFNHDESSAPWFVDASGLIRASATTEETHTMEIHVSSGQWFCSCAYAKRYGLKLVCKHIVRLLIEVGDVELANRVCNYVRK